MRVRILAMAALISGLTVAALAATPAPAEKKTTAAQPVAVPSPSPTPRVRDALRGPGILDSRHDGELNGINEDITIRAGETHDGDVVCIRGHVTIDGPAQDPIQGDGDILGQLPAIIDIAPRPIRLVMPSGFRP